jgi:hypothetical protein
MGPFWQNKRGQLCGCSMDFFGRSEGAKYRSGWKATRSVVTSRNPADYAWLC